MSTLNRAVAPEIVPIKSISLLDAQHQVVNGVNVYTLHGEGQEIIQLMMYLPAGRWYEEQQLQSFLTAKLLMEGTTNKTSLEIHELVDFYGASLTVSPGYNFNTIELTTLSKHLEPLLELVEDIFFNPTFSEDELATKKTKFQQRLKVNLEKTDYLAQREFHNKMFGESHPYGYSSEVATYDTVSAEDLKRFYESNFTLNEGFVFFAGNLTNNVKAILEPFVEKVSAKNQEVATPEHTVTNQPGSYRVHKENAQQASIRIGALSIGDAHEDYIKLQVANTILGGYFGSRLMSNIREDKGYTYGIYSMLGSFVKQPYFLLSTDVGVEFADATLKEIYFEIDRMQNELVSDEELELVKNYMMGQNLRKIDGTFAQAKVLTTILSRNSNAEEFVSQVQQIQTVTPEDVLAVAKKYWQKEHMVEVVAGV